MPQGGTVPHTALTHGFGLPRGQVTNSVRNPMAMAAFSVHFGAPMIAVLLIHVSHIGHGPPSGIPFTLSVWRKLSSAPKSGDFSCVDTASIVEKQV